MMRRGLLSLAFLLILGVPASAQENWQAYDFFNLTGGLNDTFDPTAIAPNEASALQNVVFSTSGGIAKRAGYGRLTASSLGSSVVFTGLGFYSQADGDRFLVALTSNGATDQVYKMDYGSGTSGPDGTWDDVSASLSLSFADDELADFATAQDTLYIAYGDGTRSLLKYTGSGDATELTSLPDATMVEFHKRILWLAGRSDARSRIDFSNLDDAETFTATDFILVETDDNQVITGLKSALNCLYVFKTNSIWRICGADRDNLTLEQMVTGIGAASNQAIATINNQFLFVTSQGDVAVYDGGITVQIVSSKIEGTLGSLNYQRFTKAIAVAFDDGTGDEDYYVSLSSGGSGTHDTVLVFDSFHRAWTRFSGLNVAAMAVYEIGSRQRGIAFGDYGGLLYRYPYLNSDDGSAIDSYYQSGHLRLDIPTQKTFRMLQAILQQESSTYTVSLEYRLDFAGAGTVTALSLAGSGALWDTAVWDSAVWADVSTSIRPVSIVGGTADFLQWRISNDGASQPYLLRGIRLWASPTGRVGGSN